MRFDNISISNMRLVGQEPFSLNINSQKNVLILLGDNGYGKTTLLDALATTIAPYVSQFPGIGDFQLSDLDVHINEQGKKAPFLMVDAQLSDGELQFCSTRYRKGTTNTPKANYEDLKQEAIVKKNDIISGKLNVDLPVFAYYGTGRGKFYIPERKRGFRQTFERWDCYKNAIMPDTDFKRFFEWFDLMEDEERRERERLRDFNYVSPVLECVRKALSDVIDDYKNPHILTRPLRFVMDKINEDGTKQELRIEQLSEGYKIIIAMVADLAARMAEANPNMDDPLKTTGIVLIDEVDLHLHPQWQRKILRQLSTVFPNIQFIVSTHSPVIVVGAADIAQVVNLSNRDKQLADKDDGLNLLNIGQILLSDLFGLRSLQSPNWDDKIHERNMILAKEELDADDKKRLNELDKDMTGLTSIQNSDTIRSVKLIEKIAKQLNVEL